MTRLGLKSFVSFASYPHTSIGDLVHLFDETTESVTDRVFVTGSYEPPAVAGPVQILIPGENGMWRPLFDLLGVQPLTRAGLIQTVLLPAFGALDESRQLAVLQWLRDEFSKARTEVGEAGGSGQELKRAVTEAPLIRCTDDDELHPAAKVYDPRSTLVREVLGARAKMPDPEYYAAEWEDWLDFFRMLGMADKPLAQDLLAHIDRIRSEVKDVVPEAVTEQLLRVFDHVSAYWADLKDRTVGGAPAVTFQQHCALQVKGSLASSRTRSRLPAATPPGRPSPPRLPSTPPARFISRGKHTWLRARRPFSGPPENQKRMCGRRSAFPRGVPL